MTNVRAGEERGLPAWRWARARRSAARASRGHWADGLPPSLGAPFPCSPPTTCRHPCDGPHPQTSQLEVAKEVIADITKQAMWPAPIVTKLLPLARDGPAQFWRAEVRGRGKGLGRAGQAFRKGGRAGSERL